MRYLVYSLAVCLLILFGGCGNGDHSFTLKIITDVDKTENDNQYCRMINSDQYFYLMDIDQRNPSKAPLTTCIFREITEMNMSYTSLPISLKKPKLDNPRGYQIEHSVFRSTLDKEIVDICKNAKSGLPYSRIFGPLVESLSMLDADKNILLLYSDMIERYDENLQFTAKFLKKYPDDEILEMLEEKYGLSLPDDLSKVEVYIIYDPGRYRHRVDKNGNKYDTSDLAYSSGQFFSRVLQERGAKVYLRTQL